MYKNKKAKLQRVSKTKFDLIRSFVDPCASYSMNVVSYFKFYSFKEEEFAATSSGKIYDTGTDFKQMFSLFEICYLTKD